MKILLATDGSSCSDAAVSEMCRRPWPEGTEVRIITVDAPWKEELSRGRSSSMFDEMNKQLRAEAWQSQRCCSRIQAECTRLNCHPRVPGRSSERYNFRRGGALGWGWKIGDTPLGFLVDGEGGRSLGREWDEIAGLRQEEASMCVPDVVR